MLAWCRANIWAGEWDQHGVSEKRGARHSVLSNRRILVVEDEAPIALALVTILEDQGAIVVGPAQTVGAALRLIVQSQIDCAILDIKLAGEYASAVADALSRRHVPFAFLTGFDDNVVPFRHGGRPTIHKPFTSVSILQTIDSLIAK